MELDKYQDSGVFEFDRLVENVRVVLEADDAKGSYYRKLLDESINRDFAEALIGTLSQRQNLDWDLYALRSLPMLTYPGSRGTGISAGETIYYSHEYERYSQPAKEIWQQTFTAAGHLCSQERDRGFLVEGLMRKNVYALLETYSLIIFTNAQELIHR